VKDIRLIRDQRSGKSKGVGYVEFSDVESVMKALALNGIAFKGQPLLVQASMAEKNRLAQAAKNVAAANAMMGGGAAAEPVKLMVSELHPHIAATDLREVFSPFGELADVSMADGSVGIAYVTFVKSSDAKDAQAAINGLELAGKNIVVQFMQEIPSSLASLAIPGLGALGGGFPGLPGAPGMSLDDNFGAERAMLMGRLNGTPAAPAAEPSCCALLKNMFDPNGEDERNDKDFFDDLREDITEECGKHGTVISAKIDPKTAGFVYMKFADVDAAGRCVNSLNNRWFAGKQITADYVSESTYASAC